MPFTKKPDNEVGKLRTFRLSDRINDLIVEQQGSLANWNRQYEKVQLQLQLLSQLETSHYDELLSKPAFKREEK